jgi:dihydropteroate synthase
MTTPRRICWKCRSRVLDFAERPLVMGILNVTPDSFSDGGRCADPAAAIARGRQLAAEGADIVDVGGESTRPGAAAVDAAEELRRVVPVVERLAGETQALVSVDTTKAAVARAALRAGASIVNDVSALTQDPDMPAAAAEFGAGVVLMHMQGTPRTMQADPRYEDVVAEVKGYLQGRVAALVRDGMPEESLAVDPGIGFGKSLEHNARLLGGLRALAAVGRPVVVGLSRKSFLGRITGREVDDRLAGSLAGLVFCMLNGAHVLRVHDVKESLDAVRVAATLRHWQE